MVRQSPQGESSSDCWLNILQEVLVRRRLRELPLPQGQFATVSSNAGSFRSLSLLAAARRCQTRFAVGALARLQFGNRSRLTVLKTRRDAPREVGVRFRTPSKGSRCNVFSAP